MRSYVRLRIQTYVVFLCNWVQVLARRAPESTDDQREGESCFLSRSSCAIWHIDHLEVPLPVLCFKVFERALSNFQRP